MSFSKSFVYVDFDNYYNLAGFLIFENLCLDSSKIPYIGNSYHRNERHLTLSFTKHSQNVCIIDYFNVLVCQIWLQVIKHPIIFFWVFLVFHWRLTSIHFWAIVSSLNSYRLCIWLLYTFWYVNMPNETV